MASEPRVVGYGRPPQSTRFKKGVSGNPRGRPRKRQANLPYEAVLGRMVTVREDGRERRITAAEAFILHLTKKGLEGCGASARASLASIENARAVRGEVDDDALSTIVFSAFDISRVVEDLGMAVRLNWTSEQNIRVKLKPWVVEAALARMTTERLSLEEQRIVFEATRTTDKVRWPDWWQVRS